METTNQRTDNVDALTDGLRVFADIALANAWFIALVCVLPVLVMYIIMNFFWDDFNPVPHIVSATAITTLATAASVYYLGGEFNSHYLASVCKPTADTCLNAPAYGWTLVVVALAGGMSALPSSLVGNYVYDKKTKGQGLYVRH